MNSFKVKQFVKKLKMYYLRYYKTYYDLYYLNYKQTKTK
jgi:hypothetical protein